MKAPPLVPVLLADENDADAEEITKVLQADGHFDAVRIKIIDTVMENLQKRNIDILLLSIALSGANFENIVKIHTAEPDVAIVVVSDSRQAETAARAIRAGAQDYYVCGQTTPSSLLRIIRNARERSRLQQALRVSEDRYRDLVENSEDLICTHDLKGNLLSVNARASALLGYALDDWRGKNVREILAPETRDQFDQYLREIATKGSSKGFMVVMTKSGEKRIWEFNNSLRSDGVVTPIVRGLAHDVTEQKRVEKALRKHAAILQEQARLLDLAHEAILVTDGSGLVTYWNCGAERMYRFSKEEAIGHVNQEFLQTEFPKPLEEILALLEKEDYWEGELKQKNKSGNTILVFSRWTLSRNDSGDITQILQINSDITEIKSLQQQIALLQRIETIGRLAGGIAHDFNNILMAIYGTCDLLLYKLPEGDSIREDIEQILKAAERGASLTRQMLAFSRKQILSPKVLELNRLLLNMENMIRRLMGDDIELILDFGSDVGNVLADPVQVEQVVMNLVVNARDAMPYGGRLIIETSNVVMDEDFARLHAGAVPGPYILMSFNDTGYGMDAATLSRVFEPFFTTKEVGKGTGLGLASVYGVVKQSGGYILVSSEPGRGSSFKIYLPRVDRVAEEEAKENTSSPAREKAMTILIVDDSESVRKIISHMLQIRGYNVLEADSGQQALSISRDFNGVIHLMITDVVMPHMGGPELARVITSERSDVRVLFMSGYPEKELYLKESMPEHSVFLSKPASIDSIIQKIAQIFEQ